MFKLSGSRNEAANPIYAHYEIGKQMATAGPSSVWKVYEGHRKNDGKEVSIFVFDKKSIEKSLKPKRREAVRDLLKNGVKQLERQRHPRILQVMHTVEECAETLAFATEPVMASLANVLAGHKDTTTTTTTTATSTTTATTDNSQFVRDYNFLDMELKYGILQITEALSFLHHTARVIHRSVCPSSILITKRGTWKLACMDFSEAIGSDAKECIECQPWTSRIPKMCQPDLDYIAPECQTSSRCSALSDMFSLGLVICSVFNSGHSLLSSSNSLTAYTRQLDMMNDLIKGVLPKIPLALQEAIVRLLNKDFRQRPTAQLLALIKYFSDPAVHALQFLDVINMKDPCQKSNFFRTTLPEVLPFIPRKLWFQHIWPHLREDMLTQEVLAAVLQPILYIINEISEEEYQTIILPRFRCVFSWSKSIQASVTLLENLHIIMEKTPPEEVQTDVMPIIYVALDSTTTQIQRACLLAIPNVAEAIDEEHAKNIVFPKVKAIYEKNSSDLLITLYTLLVLEKILDKLERRVILEELLPMLLDLRVQDPDIIQACVNIYRAMMSEPKRYGFSVSIVATRVMPTLLPLTMNASLHLDQFTSLLELLQYMLDSIERTQRNKLKLDNLPGGSIEQVRRQSTTLEHQQLRHRTSSDNMAGILSAATAAITPTAVGMGGSSLGAASSGQPAPPFHIPNLRVEPRRKTNSAEDCRSTGSVGSLLVGPSSPDSNLLRVHSALIGRRLSDNQLLNPPKIRVGASLSCCSSANDLRVGALPIRRHSSTGPSESRRTSIFNLSPPTSGSVPNTNHLSATGGLLSRRQSTANLSSLAISGLGSKRGSCASISAAAAAAGQQGSGLLQQLSSGMVSQRTCGSYGSGGYSNNSSYAYSAGRKSPLSVMLPLSPLMQRQFNLTTPISTSAPPISNLTTPTFANAAAGGLNTLRRAVPTIQRQVMQ